MQSPLAKALNQRDAGRGVELLTNIAREKSIYACVSHQSGNGTKEYFFVK